MAAFLFGPSNKKGYQNSMKELVAEISTKGVVSISVNGIKGESCREATKALEKRLGAEFESTPTGEMYESDQAQLHSSSGN